MTNFGLNPDHFLWEPLMEALQCIEGQKPAIDALKREIVKQLLDWHRPLEAVNLIHDGPIFIVKGVREQIEETLGKEAEAIGIDGDGIYGGIVVLQEARNLLKNGIAVQENRKILQLGSVCLSQEDIWNSVGGEGRHNPLRLEAPIFNPHTHSQKPINIHVISKNGPGPFVLSAKQAVAARTAMAAERISEFIHRAEESSKKQDSPHHERIIATSLQSALEYCNWVKKHIPKVAS